MATESIPVLGPIAGVRIPEGPPPEVQAAERRRLRQAQAQPCPRRNVGGLERAITGLAGARSSEQRSVRTPERLLKLRCRFWAEV